VALFSPHPNCGRAKGRYVVRAKDCTVNVEQGWRATKLCQHCSQFAKHISNMAKSANHDPTIQGGTTRVTAKAAATMTPTKLKRVLTAQRRQSNCTARSLRRQVKQLKQKIEKSKELHSLSDDNSKFLGEQVFQKALPYLEQHYP
jgi:carbohydrate-binding DOMON domain-containing protein